MNKPEYVYIQCHVDSYVSLQYVNVAANLIKVFCKVGKKTAP